MEDTSEERKAGEGDWVCCNGAAGCSIEGAEGVLGRGNSQGGSVPGELWNRQEASEAAE